MISVLYYFCMSDEHQTPDRIAELLIHVGRAARSEDGRSKLTAAQWTCLRFLARANGDTRTPSNFANFQATTRGTASQIIKSLESKRLVTRHRSERDGRSVYFDLTQAGRQCLKDDPLGDLIGVIGGLKRGERKQFLETLSRLAIAVAELRDVPAFGTCNGCSHFTSSDGAAYCACMSAELAVDQIDKLCASYREPT